MEVKRFYLRFVTGLVCLLGIFHKGSGFGPRKLYSLSFDRNIASVKVINRQMFFTGHYQISVIDNVQWKFRQRGRMKPRIINKDIGDPRTIGKIPARTFRGDRGTSYWVSSWATNHTSGAIHVLKQTSTYSVIADISIDSGWNYVRTQWVDMNRDRRRDCLTARFRGGVGQMLWFEQPAGQTIWGQHIIHEGLADGNFVGFFYDKKTYIAVAGNQFNTLGLYWTLDRRNNWKNSRQVRHRVVDNYGKYFDVQYIDLNRDGRADILTTTVQIASSRGQVLGYEIPYDIQNKAWQRHVLAAGYVGDYSPGKATAYWPNKWKRKSDRPSIFLTGGSEATLYILSPTPRSRGWGYYQSELLAGSGMPGIPFIMDMNGDSFPEIFVPQGSQVHVFSYDYRTSTANPKRRKSSTAGKVTIKKRPIKFRPPFFRPTPSSLPPAIPADATPVATPPPTRASSLPTLNLPAPRTSAPSLYNLGGGPYLLSPRTTSPPVYPIDNSWTNSLAPRSQQPASPRPLQPVSPLFPQQSNPLSSQPVNRGGQPISNQRRTIVGSDGWLYTRTGFSFQQPFGNTGNSSIVPLNPTNNIPLSASDVPVANTDFFGGRAPITEANVASNAPPNLVLWVTEDTFTYHSEASDICQANKRVLCSLQQLQDAVRIGGVVPVFEWGWYASKDRAAGLRSCLPGNVKWDGYVCYNGDVEHTAVVQETTLPALCCAVINGANVTKQKFMRKSDAATACTSMGQHLCSLSEMITAWHQSSYKDVVRGWFDSADHLVKMTHFCDINSIPWPGYTCIDGKLEMTKIETTVQEHAFCCRSAGQSLRACFFSLLFVLCVAFAWPT